MKYTPSELAEEMNCCVDTIYKTYIPAGCPCERDQTGHVWIIGTDFAQWAREIHQRRKEKLGENQAYCLHCRKAVDMVGPIMAQPTNRNIEIIIAKCAECGTTVTRARARQHG
jgi:hypothetical protein